MGNGGQTLKIVLTAIALIGACTAAAQAACSNDQIDLRGDWGTARFSVEVADDSDERAQGLMHRETMARSSGMLFVYERPRTVRFWMRNTLIPLDMVFADASGTVKRIHHEAVPLDETLIFGGDDIQYVLEINGGLAQQLGIKEGSHLRHPAIAGAGVVWACDAAQ